MTPESITLSDEMTKKVRRCACVLVFFGELTGQSQPTDPSRQYTFSEEMLEGFSVFCTDLGFDLLDALK